MKRRNFLKGLLGASAVATIPALANIGGGSSNKDLLYSPSDSFDTNPEGWVLDNKLRIGDIVSLQETPRGIELLPAKPKDKVLGVWDGSKIVDYGFLPPMMRPF
jgi:hypothetical protein